MAAGAVAAAGAGCSSNTKPAAAPTASSAATPTISSVLGLPVGAIDRARVVAACTGVSQADTLLAGDAPAEQVAAQLTGAADALGPPAALTAHPDVAQLAAEWRAATTPQRQRAAVDAGLAWCRRQHA